MRRRVGIVVGIVLLAAAGCAESHGVPGADAGGLGDDGGRPVPVCRPGDSPPYTSYCVYVGADHVCGDAALSPTCVDGAWACPAGTGPASLCWCSGFGPHDPACVCTPSGWSCPTEPADAGPPTPVCPADPAAAVGSPCTVEGQSCGSCPSPCSGSCNMATCIDHTWQTLDFGCADPLFSCGPAAYCARFSEVCEHILSDVGGVPDEYRCEAAPPGCSGDCTCFGGGPTDACASDGAGGVTVTSGGG